MASANLDLVRSIFAPWERGDFSSVEWAHPEIEYVVADGVQPGIWMGVTSMVERWSDGLTVWDDLRVNADEYRELDDERVLVIVRRSGRGKSSGLELGQIHTQGACLFHIRDGKVTRYVTYFDRKSLPGYVVLSLAREATGAD
jgi:ketosteroid isomerase-like protein